MAHASGSSLHLQEDAYLNVCQGQILQPYLGQEINTPKSLSLDTYPFVCSCQEKLDLEKLQWLLKAFLKKCAAVPAFEPLDSLYLACFFFARLRKIQILSFFLFFFLLSASSLRVNAQWAKFKNLSQESSQRQLHALCFDGFGQDFPFGRAIG